MLRQKFLVLVLFVIPLTLYEFEKKIFVSVAKILFFGLPNFYHFYLCGLKFLFPCTLPGSYSSKILFNCSSSSSSSSSSPLSTSLSKPSLPKSAKSGGNKSSSSLRSENIEAFEQRMLSKRSRMPRTNSFKNGTEAKTDVACCHKFFVPRNIFVTSGSVLRRRKYSTRETNSDHHQHTYIFFVWLCV